MADTSVLGDRRRIFKLMRQYADHELFRSSIDARMDQMDSLHEAAHGIVADAEGWHVTELFVCFSESYGYAKYLQTSKDRITEVMVTAAPMVAFAMAYEQTWTIDSVFRGDRRKIKMMYLDGLTDAEVLEAVHRVRGILASRWSVLLRVAGELRIWGTISGAEFAALIHEEAMKSA